jgi:MYXO-CTERM domain-containing protein
MLRSPLALGTALGSTLLLFAGTARAIDCPPGSNARTEGGYTWCEPTVCASDGQCSAGEICREIALCVQVGKLDPKGAALADAAERLVVTQRCAKDNTCPQTTVCSDMKRCVSRADAERMGLAGSPLSTPAADAPNPTARKSCGCGVVGAEGARASFLVALAAVALGAARRRRRAD